MNKLNLNSVLFSKEHEWVKIDANKALMGISDFAQHALGDVVYVELPQVGKTINKGAAIGVVESVKAVSDIYAPVSGVVQQINQQVLDHPEKINQDPYGEGWLIMIELTNKADEDSLLNYTDYQKLLEEEAKC